MTVPPSLPSSGRFSLAAKRGSVLGIADEHGIAVGRAKAMDIFLPLFSTRRAARRTIDAEWRHTADRHFLRLGTRGAALRPDGAGERGAGERRALCCAQLGPRSIRIHAISPGPIRTRAAGGLEHFDEILAAAANASEHHLVDIDNVGGLAAFLISDAAQMITGTIIPIDGGQRLLA